MGWAGLVVWLAGLVWAGGWSGLVAGLVWAGGMDAGCGSMGLVAWMVAMGLWV